MATKKAATTKGMEDKATTLQISPGPAKTQDQHLAELAAAGVAGNAYAIVQYAKGTFGDLSLTECVKALQATGKAVNEGDLAGAEVMLASQAAALNNVFCELARRAALNMGEYPDAFERYMRLALKAQGQARATLETLAAIKNPPVVFARQANINHGGQQQVNNGPAPERCEVSAHAGETALRKARNGPIEGSAEARAHAGETFGDTPGGVQSLQAPDLGTAFDPTQGVLSPCESNQAAPVCDQYAHTRAHGDSLKQGKAD